MKGLGWEKRHLEPNIHQIVSWGTSAVRWAGGTPPSIELLFGVTPILSDPRHHLQNINEVGHDVEIGTIPELTTWPKEGESCSSPRRRPGTCINLKDCLPLMTLLRQPRPLPPDVVDFLRR
uniref:Clip domain-containing protein n=1 Tax=Timema bartmani TaxID=61472 RepID=A0A7R9F2S8_9NEOP|nr:unnamed protein product [Timema bartmani]